VVLHYPSGFGLRISHGLNADGSTVQPRHGEAPPSGPFYLLDFDAFREASPEEAPPIDPAAIGNLVQSFNEAIYRIFRWSVRGEYLATLGGLHGG